MGGAGGTKIKTSDIIKKYKLNKHPEGGWYREIIRSENIITYKGKERNTLTSIYFLLCDGEASRWHNVDSDEIWIFLDGEPLELHQADLKTGKYHIEIMGPVDRQVIVPAGTWQAAKPGGHFSFAACVVAPGFEFEGFKMINKKSLKYKKILKLNKRAGEFIEE